ncbi:MAG: hypothetical protein KGH64_05635 [Candidatus Micrarchaeota archaeon]|nr:hypothetical protein [Candidatus Micrarchaeota archaeon]MDE1859554.1 hypothetical protein [Candidatus Micrarchaeota archaeon]
MASEKGQLGECDLNWSESLGSCAARKRKRQLSRVSGSGERVNSKHQIFDAKIKRVVKELGEVRMVAGALGT